ncbi:hypothetical protein C8R28_10702 [Nitrosomonas ureae]|uniref:Uncharacterized protein n=1 Tax=Nitrosomonas ureae TaxID=44577 RepID=A0A2T5I1X9_9PROT|nr:hypothetical protein C8R28_10702 [Nitrosomonas ureae]
MVPVLLTQTQQLRSCVVLMTDWLCQTVKADLFKPEHDFLSNLKYKT